MDSVIPTPVLITVTMVLATSTCNTLVVLAHAMELDQAMITAITIPARVTCIVGRAISTEVSSAVTGTAAELRRMTYFAITTHPTNSLTTM